RMITLFPKNARDRKQIECLELCNYLSDNKDRDTGVNAMFERVDDTTDFKYRRDRRRNVQEVIAVVDSFTDDEVSNFTRASNLPDRGPPEMRRYALDEFAEKKPDLFLNAPIADYTALYDLIEDARGKKIINYNSSNHTWMMFDGGEIRKV